MMADTNETQEKETKKVFQLGDDLIAVIRELIQLSILTGTNIVDHIRAIQAEVDDESGKLVPTIDYVEAYNLMIEELQAEVEKTQKELESKQADGLEQEKPDSYSVTFAKVDDDEGTLN